MEGRRCAKEACRALGALATAVCRTVLIAIGCSGSAAHNTTPAFRAAPESLPACLNRQQASV